MSIKNEVDHSSQGTVRVVSKNFVMVHVENKEDNWKTVTMKMVRKVYT